MVSSNEVQIVKRVNGLTAWIESVRKERGTEEARRLVLSSWIDYHVSLGRAYSLGAIAQALGGTSDFERFKSASSAVPGQFTLAELIACGVSDKGIARVIAKAGAPGSSDSCKRCSCRCSDCKGGGCRLWPAPSDEEVGRACKNWREGTGARWQ